MVPVADKIDTAGKYSGLHCSAGENSIANKTRSAMALLPVAAGDRTDANALGAAKQAKHFQSHS